MFNFVSPTFTGVADGTVKLGDLKLKVEASGNSTLQFFNGGGASDKVTEAMIGSEAYAEFGDVDAFFVYCNEADAESYGMVPGWYLIDDWYGAGAYPMNDIVLRKGQAVVLDAQDSDVELVSAGQVDEGVDGEIALPFTMYVFNFMGNVTPVDLTLGDLVLNVASSGNTTLQFFNGGGASDKVTEAMIGSEAYAEFGDVDAFFVFCNEDDAESYGMEPGWYLIDDWYGAGAYPMNSIPLAAGQGSVLDAQDDDLEVVLPSALKPAAK